ncbi:MAG: protein phosphatase 2C domain-containing protein [Bacteroidota bacterium]
MDRNYFGGTDIGKIRDNNEDTFIAEKISGSNLIIACVIDGVGGYAGGEIASEIAKASILQHLSKAADGIPAAMKSAIINADAEIMTEKRLAKDHEKMACVLTLAVVDLQQNQFFYAHVGDTRLYLLRDQSLIKITKDQSFVGFMEDSGRLTEEQAMRHPKRNEINKALGFGVNMAGQDDYIEMGQSPFLPGDLLLICSDGLSDMVNKKEITNILTSAVSLQDKASELITAANKNGGKDNITVVLVKNDREAKVHTAEKPTARTEVKPLEKPVTETLVAAEPVTVYERTEPAPAVKKNRSGLLAVLCVLLLAVVVYLLWQNNRASTALDKPLTITKPPRNPQEKKLQDTLNRMTSNTLILTDSLFKSPILITEPLQIKRDTLYLIAAKGITIKRDSSFHKAPIEVTFTNKHLSLENFTFEDFNTVILSQSNALVFKNVRFINSPNAVQIIQRFPQGKYINGKMPKSTFKADSLPVTLN